MLANHGLPKMVNHNKTVHCPHGTYLSDTFLLDHELSDWSKKQRALSLSVLSVVLWVSFNRFLMKETISSRKADNFAYFSRSWLIKRDDWKGPCYIFNCKIRCHFIYFIWIRIETIEHYTSFFQAKWQGILQLNI